MDVISSGARNLSLPREISAMNPSHLLSKCDRCHAPALYVSAQGSVASCMFKLSWQSFCYHRDVGMSWSTTARNSRARRSQEYSDAVRDACRAHLRAVCRVLSESEHSVLDRVWRRLNQKSGYALRQNFSRSALVDRDDRQTRCARFQNAQSERFVFAGMDIYIACAIQRGRMRHRAQPRKSRPYRQYSTRAPRR